MIVDHPCIFWTLAAVVTLYHGMRGVIINVRAVAAEQGKSPWPQWQRIYVHYVHGFILNAFGSLAGFGALFLASEIYRRFTQRQYIDTGMSILFGFLVLVAITGVTGLLPEMLYRGGLFGHNP